MSSFSRLARSCALLAALAPLPRGGLALAATTAVAAPPSGAAVNGFRSAVFGMNEAAIRHAIAGDFNLQGNAVQSVVNPQNQTQNITIQVPQLIGALGKANVDYVLGYRSHRLMEVVVVWSATGDPANAGPAILKSRQPTAHLLRE